MKLNKLEFHLMNNPLRSFIQERYELPVWQKMTSSAQFDSVLEIGCGNGTGTRLIKKYFKPSQITAIDLDDKMVKLAEKNNKNPCIVYRVMDAADLKFADNTFDAIFDFGIIHHIPDWRVCLTELYRVLKPGGELFIEDLSTESFSGFPGQIWRTFLAHPYKELFSVDEFIQHLEELGFSIGQIRRLNPLKLIKFFSLVAMKS